MGKISKFQLYCMMVILTAPIAFLETPKRLFNLLGNNAWMAAFTSIIPGILIILLYISLINKSRSPFPLMLEEHLGKIAGKALGFIYIWLFILFSSYTLRLFVDFTESYVLPATPISVFTTLMLLASFFSLRAGLTAMARLSEIIIYIGLSFTIIIIVLAIITNPEWENLRPLGYMSLKNFALATLSASSVWGRMIIVLTIAYFVEKKTDIAAALYPALITSVMLIGFISMATILNLGAPAVKQLTFPTFAVIRIIKLGEFVQHLDILFVALWVLGMYATLFYTWFMACFTAQQVFGLREYRFLAAPTILIIGILSILLSENILELRIVSMVVIPLLYIAAFIIIPFIVWLFTLFKPAVESSPSKTASG